MIARLESLKHLRPFKDKISFCGKSVEELEHDLRGVKSEYVKLGLWDKAFSKSTPFAIEDYKGFQALVEQ